ncbi:MAG TPA: hypothetical protein VHE83_10465, partial [Mycobacteriales bacterium]|nr:hypothetical protein [Mycobacteriales bacterium]
MLTTTLSTTTARRRARTALLGALGVAVLSIPFATPAGADDSSFDYSGKVGAIAIQVMADTNPEPSSVADLTDLQVTTTDAAFDSYGTSDSSGHVGNLNGLGQLPGLLCLAGLPCPSGFPPADPLDAHAAYPSPTSADAPVVNGKVAQLSGGSPSSAQVATGTAHAEADLKHVLATATGNQTTLVSNVTIGGSTASQLAHIAGGALVTHAE